MTRRIVIADDDAAIRSLIRLTLPPGDYEVLEATDGPDVLRLLDERAPDLLLLDWQMPGADGGHVLDRVKALDRGTRVIMLTAQTRPEYRTRAEELGADAFMTKPFSPLRLLGVIDDLLGPRPAPPAGGAA
jgi:CheY-like chemotaxis protein